MSRLIGALNSGTALVADVTGRGAELMRGVVSGGATALVCCVGPGEDWERMLTQVILGCESAPWGVALDAHAPASESVLLSVIDRGADFVILPADVFPAWGLDVLESFPKVGRVISVPHNVTGDQAQVMETLGPQAIVVRLEDSALTIEALAGARVIFESVALRSLAWMAGLTSRESRLLRQVGAAGFIVGVGQDEPDWVMSRVHGLSQAISEPVPLRGPLA